MVSEFCKRFKEGSSPLLVIIGLIRQIGLIGLMIGLISPIGLIRL